VNALRRTRALLCFIALTCGFELLSSPSRLLRADDAADGRIEFFEKQIRPLLVEHCLECHSNEKQAGGLSMETQAQLLEGGDSGPAIIPGQPEISLLIQAVDHTAEPRMPPSGKISAARIDSLRRWIADGAAWPAGAVLTVSTPERPFVPSEQQRQWWAFQPLRPVTVPDQPELRQFASEIDRFLLDRLRTADLDFAEPAERSQLLRRVTFALTGLPPTPEETAAFLADRSPAAFATVVERLLASPHYGERWARNWLDVARYADYYDANPATRTASCELTEAWRYRDWVTAAFNRDLPYDQFIRHQIAGDLLPDPQGGELYADGLVATTFLANGVWDRGDADKEKIVSDMVDDNIGVIGRAFLGLTLDCARCHDHKFDPVSTADYYALAGMFYSSHILKELGAKGGEYTMNRVPLLGPAALAERAAREQRLASVTAELAELDREQRLRRLLSAGRVLQPTAFHSAAGAVGTVAPDGVITVTGTLASDSYRIETMLPPTVPLRFLVLEALPDPTLPASGPGRAGDGNFVVSRLSAALIPDAPGLAPMPLKFVSAEADFEQAGFAAKSVLDENPADGWAVSPQLGRTHAAAFELAAEPVVPEGARLVLTIEQLHSASHNLGRFRLLAAAELPELPADVGTRRQALASEQEGLQQALAVPVPLAMAVTEGGTAGGLFPGIQDVPIHIRGSYARLGPVTPRRLPVFFAGEAQPKIEQGSGRRELADWVAAPRNPLTARVLVNRVWAWHFGEGLVRTPSNFGLLSEPPSHPELLDWLAARFIEDGWSLRQLHRRILLTTAWQQSGTAAAAALERDPENRLLSRFSPRRLQAEELRDAVLAVNGQLDLTPGGPAGDDFTIRRRSLYVQTARWQRDSYANLFDAANPDASTEKRITSTVAPQALLLLNHPWMQDQARLLVERVSREVPGDDVVRLRRIWQLLFARDPTDQEQTVALQVLASGSDGWQRLAHVLLCSNEFVYLD
jgi:hypothetical protein